jgi:4-amino-4-deoxy-L-arabinose transferase-like glycosyltransferase
VPLTLAISIAMWAALRALDREEKRPGIWASVLWVSMAVAILIKGFIGLLLPSMAILTYLGLTRTLFEGSTWQRLRPGLGLAILMLVAGPWHVLAIWRHPPYFDFSLVTEPVRYRGFFWFYFVNEHVLRFLGQRYPRDYTSIPVAQFLLLHLVWLFPASVFLPRLRLLDYAGSGRAGRARLFVACWAATVVLFFCVSTRLEYYTLPAYPAFAHIL